MAAARGSAATSGSCSSTALFGVTVSGHMPRRGGLQHNGNYAQHTALCSTTATGLRALAAARCSTGHCITGHHRTGLRSTGLCSARFPTAPALRQGAADLCPATARRFMHNEEEPTYGVIAENVPCGWLGSLFPSHGGDANPLAPFCPFSSAGWAPRAFGHTIGGTSLEGRGPPPGGHTPGGTLRGSGVRTHSGIEVPGFTPLQGSRSPPLAALVTPGFTPPQGVGRITPSAAVYSGAHRSVRAPRASRTAHRKEHASCTPGSPLSGSCSRLHPPGVGVPPPFSGVL